MINDNISVSLTFAESDDISRTMLADSIINEIATTPQYLDSNKFNHLKLVVGKLKDDSGNYTQNEIKDQLVALFDNKHTLRNAIYHEQKDLIQ